MNIRKPADYSARYAALNKLISAELLEKIHDGAYLEVSPDSAAKICYGWSIARYAVTTDVPGPDATQGAYGRDPKEFKARVLRHLGLLCPEAFDYDLEKLIW